MELSCTRLTPALGATVTLPSESGEVSEELADAIHAALVEHCVLVLPEADLDAARMVRLGAALGTLGMRHHSYRTHPESEDVVVLTWEGDQKPDAAEWHADMTYRPEPPFASILKAVEVPPVGGDTLWASMFAVHDALDPGLRRDLEQLEAVHDMGRSGPTPIARLETRGWPQPWPEPVRPCTRSSSTTPSPAAPT